MKTMPDTTAAKRLAKTVRDELADSNASELAERARERARHSREDAMVRLGEWMTNTPVAEQMGLQRRRRWPLLVGVLLGALAGVAAGVLLSRRGGAQDEHANWGAPENLAPPLGEGQVDLRHPAGIEEAVRRRLAEDSRTSTLGELVVNVAEGTAFVRGTVPPGADEGVIGDVVRSVDGIDEVDLQVTVRA